jgi:hypothetical protein
LWSFDKSHSLISFGHIAEKSWSNWLQIYRILDAANVTGCINYKNKSFVKRITNNYFEVISQRILAHNNTNWCHHNFCYFIIYGIDSEFSVPSAEWRLEFHVKPDSNFHIPKETHTLKAQGLISDKKKETHQYIVSPEETNFLQIQSGTIFSKISICSSASPIGRKKLVSYDVY